MRKLYILGPPELRDEKGSVDQSFLTGSKRLALLAYLALSRPDGYKRRDSLLPLFWPDSDEKSARNALSNILYHMRESLGSDIVVNRGKDEIKLSELWCDTDKFEESIKKGDHRKAFDLYRGPLLEGLHISGASSKFEEWLEAERQRLARKYRNLLESMAENAQQQGDIERAVELWDLCKQEAPYESAVTRKLIVALTAAGQKSDALQIAEDFSEKMEAELGADAKAEFNTLIRDLDQAASEIRKNSETEQIKAVESFEDYIQGIKNLDAQTKESLCDAFNRLREAAGRGLKQKNLDRSGRQKTYENALKLARKVRNQQPGIALTHFAEGLALYHLKRYPEALFALEEAVALVNNGESGNLTQTQVWSVLAASYAANGEPTETEKLLDRIQLNSDWYSAGLVLASLGQYDKATSAFQNGKPWNSFHTLCLRHLFPDVLDPIKESKIFD